MTPGAIHGHNMVLKGNGDDVQDLPCVRDHNSFATAWIPTPVELDALNNGGSVILFVIGDRHPPVYLGVREA